MKDNSIKNINNNLKKVNSFDDLLEYNTINNLNKNIYIPKCLCGFSDLKFIGSGAFSIVFSALHLLDKNTYALKCIPLPNDKNKIKEKTREILFLSRLSHKNIIRYYNSWIEFIPNKIPKFITNNIEKIVEIESNLDIFLFLQMECVDITLKNFLDLNKKPIPNTNIKSIMIQLVNAIEYLHKNNVIHCDLKPDNIMLKYLNGNYILKLTDFGIASIDGISNLDYRYYGSCLYSAPELDNSNFKPSTSTDIYSLGIILYEMLNHFTTDMEKNKKIVELKKAEFKTNTLIDIIISKDINLRPTINEIKRFIQEFNI